MSKPKGRVIVDMEKYLREKVLKRARQIAIDPGTIYSILLAMGLKDDPNYIRTTAFRWNNLPVEDRRKVLEVVYDPNPKLFDRLQHYRFHELPLDDGKIQTPVEMLVDSTMVGPLLGWPAFDLLIQEHGEGPAERERKTKEKLRSRGWSEREIETLKKLSDEDGRKHRRRRRKKGK